MGKIIGLQFPEKKEASKHVCPVCGEAFAKKADLTKHMKEAHPDNTPGMPDTPPTT